MHPCHLFILYCILLKISICAHKWEWFIFPGLAFVLIYFSRVTLQLLTASFFPLSLFSLLISVFSSVFFSYPLFPYICFLLRSSSFYSYVSMCGKNLTLGLHCFFYLRTTGDIKGLLRGLSVCISSAQLCLSALRSLVCALLSFTPQLETLNVREQHACTRWL